ncbi:MAG: hypothetical protein ACOCX1_05565 [Fimbriimonadaceae bacterium]
MSADYSFFWKFSPEKRSAELEVRIDAGKLSLEVSESKLGEVLLDDVYRVYATATRNPDIRWLVVETEGGESLRVPETAKGLAQSVRDLVKFNIEVPEEWMVHARIDQEDTLWQAEVLGES